MGTQSQKVGSNFRTRGHKALGVVTLSLLAACGGGGGGGAVVEAVVSQITTNTAAEGDDLVYTVILNKPAVSSMTFPVSVDNALSTATGGSACGNTGVDYVTPPTSFTIQAGSSSASLNVRTCADDNFSEAPETLVLSIGSTSARFTATIAGGLNDTGITQYSDGISNSLVDPPSGLPGQDAAFGRDASLATNTDTDGIKGFSFRTGHANPAIPNATGNCVLDKVTGLVWEPKDSGSNQDRNGSTTYTWAQADELAARARNSNLCGYNDWRLPTASELLQIVNNGTNTGVAIDPAFVSQVAAGYWSVSVRSGDSTAAWLVDFATGASSFDGKTKSKQVRLVRGATLPTPGPSRDGCDSTLAEETPSERFEVSSSQPNVIKDLRTGLSWMKCAEGLTGLNCTGSAITDLDWRAALNHVTAVNERRMSGNRTTENYGFTDWRLPNKNELASLVERRCTNPSINTSVFPNTPLISFWTSSPVSRSGFSGQVWVVEFADGGVSPSGSTLTSQDIRGIRLVRGGQ